MTPWGFPSDATIAGCTLEHVSDVSGVQPNDIPVVYIGDDEEIRNVLDENCGEVIMESSSDFAEQFKAVTGTKRREDGRHYTAFCNSSAQGHQMYARNCRAAWDFMSQFSRNEDGSVVISERTYERPSTDGAVIDNSYNTVK